MRILKKHSKRLAALALCAVLLLGALPLGLFQASAAGWSEDYIPGNQTFFWFCLFCIYENRLKKNQEARIYLY